MCGWRLASSGVFVILLWLRLAPSAVFAREQEPCWCERLNAILDATTSTLSERYGGEAVLDAAVPIVGPGGKLRERFWAHLNGSSAPPFRIGSLGGSFVVVDSERGSWPANVTRWLDWAISSRDCPNVGAPPAALLTPGWTLHPADTPGDNGVCSARHVNHLSTHTTGLCDDAPNHDKRWPPPAICALSDDFRCGGKGCGLNARVAAAGAAPRQRATDTCDPIRPGLCAPHWGSGRYAEVALAAKGASSTQKAGWWLARLLPADGFDLLAWRARGSYS